MSLFKRGKVWWYEFWFAGRRIRESSKTGSKTVAKAAEQKRRRELEEGFNNLEDVRQERVRTVTEIADEYLVSYRLRNPRSATFAEYAVGHVKRLLENAGGCQRGDRKGIPGRQAARKDRAEVDQ
jgi:hypothetical protein